MVREGAHPTGLYWQQVLAGLLFLGATVGTIIISQNAAASIVEMIELIALQSPPKHPGNDKHQHQTQGD
jgi:hypothetical protein